MLVQLIVSQQCHAYHKWVQLNEPSGLVTVVLQLLRRVVGAVDLTIGLAPSPKASDRKHRFNSSKTGIQRSQIHLDD